MSGTVSEAQVEAGARALATEMRGMGDTTGVVASIVNHVWPQYAKPARIVLEAALDLPVEQKGEAVKALRWESIDSTSKWAAIRDLWMLYRISLRTDGMKVLRVEWLGNRDEELGHFADWDLAEAAALADLERRIRPLYALLPTDREGVEAAPTHSPADYAKGGYLSFQSGAYEDGRRQGMLDAARISRKGQS